MNHAELDRRLTGLVTRKVSANFAVLNGMPQLGCVNTLEGLDGFFSKVVGSIKKSVTAPFKMIGATVKSVKSGSFAPLKEQIKEEVKAIKSDIILMAPVAAVVANIIPGVGTVVGLAIGAAGAALKAKEDADKAKDAAAAAQAEQERMNAQLQDDYNVQVAAQAAADAQATTQAAAVQAEADAILAKTAELKKQSDIIAARTAQANVDAQLRAAQFEAASVAAKQAQQQGFIKAGMPVDEIAAQIMRQNLANNGTLMNSPEAQELIYDVAKDATANIQTAGVSGDFKSMLPWLAGTAALAFFVTRSGAGGSRARARPRSRKRR